MAGEQQSSKSKGKGKHTARVRKYNERKIGSTKAPNGKSRGGNITMRLKTKRAERHERKIASQRANKRERELLTKEAMEAHRAKKVGDLKKEFGTLNIHRLKDIINNTFYHTAWYKARLAKKAAQRKLKKSDNHVRITTPKSRKRVQREV